MHAVGGDVEAERVGVVAQPDGALSGPSTVDVPFGSQALNHEELEFFPGSLRAATIRPVSEAATASHFSVPPERLTTGVASRTFCVPSSDDSQTSPPSI